MQSNVVSLRPEDDLGRYLDQARRHPMLTPEHELELARRWRDTQDPDAARQLVASHLRLVIKLARGYGGYGFPLSELVAEGNLGLAQALTKFDPDRGFRFATYAMWWIRAAMQEHILHNWSMVKLGTTAAQKKLFFNLRRLKGRLGETGSGDLPAAAVASIAHDLAVETGEVIEMNRRLAGGDASLNLRVGEDGDHEWGDMLVDERQDQERHVAEASELAWRHDLLQSAMDVLNPRERHILTERKLKDEPATLEELAHVYGVSRERIRQIEVRAFERLQRAVLAAANDRGEPPALAA
ncbi:MAG: RNA polymerase sigma factor RpoH [Geminicoccaceae bacterium]|jgi:RNA polymerase sigma-32 factor